MQVAVVGAGLAGTAAGHGLRSAGIDAVVYEASEHVGGHTRSQVIGDVTVDEGPHVSFTKDPRVRSLFTASAGAVEDLSAKILNSYQGTWVQHPAQVHLNGLDVDLVTRCIADFAAEASRERPVRHYGDWLKAVYGETFAVNFPYRYTRKYWTVEPEELGTDWVGGRMYRPSLQEVVRGALQKEVPGDFHYVSTYRYPSRGGYQAFSRTLADACRFELGKQVVRVDTKNRELGFKDGTSATYDELVSSMPLDQLVKALDDAPSDVREAGEALLCSSIVLVDLTVGRRDLLDADWFYAYDEDIAFSRGHFPHRLSPHNAPAGIGAVQLEIYFSRKKPLQNSPEAVAQKTVEDLVRLGIIDDAQEVRTLSARTLRYANVVFDHQRQAALDVIKPFVEKRGIHLAGRFGKWDYSWTDDAVLSGWEAAASIAGSDVDTLLESSAALPM